MSGTPSTTATTKYYKLRVYVGPVHVEHYAAEARRAGLTDVLAGTEHVYGTMASTPTASYGDELSLRQRAADAVYGAPMAAGWRDVEILGAR
jgi:hypothetical protein